MPVRVGLELLDAFVVFVERLEERDRVRDVDGHRDAEFGGRGPERVEPRVVDRDETAVGPARVEAQRLPDLEAAGAGGDAVTQTRRLGLAESRVGGPARVVEAGEHGDASRQG